MSTINTIIFDLGGVLIDWNPKYLYRKIFRSEIAVNYFLKNITSSDWNEQQDAGRSLEEATDILSKTFPEYTPEIKAFYSKWEEEMLGGPIQGTVDILKTCINHPSYKVLALTNWSAETFPYAQSKFDFLDWFDGILVSGAEKMKKPDPKIYELLLTRYEIDPASSIFIDDSEKNIIGAEACGIKGIHFLNPEQLKDRMMKYKIL